LGFVGCALPSCSCFTSFVRISFGRSVVELTPGGKGSLNLTCPKSMAQRQEATEETAAQIQTKERNRKWKEKLDAVALQGFEPRRESIFATSFLRPTQQHNSSSSSSSSSTELSVLQLWAWLLAVLVLELVLVLVLGACYITTSLPLAVSSSWPFEVVVINGAAKQKGHQSRRIAMAGGGVSGPGRVDGSSAVTTSTSTSTAATVVAVATAPAPSPEPDLNGKQESNRRFVCHHLPAALEG
ncbi:hypothetical protein AWZ03_011894, partial [Drosophila navojoa]